MTASQPDSMFAVLPDPGQAGTLDELIERLRSLKTWADDPSYAVIKDRIDAAWTAAGRPAGELAGKTTVVDCFKTGRRRVNPDLVIAVVQALHPDVGYVAQWQQALRIIGAETQAGAQVRAQDTLPADLAEFTGRGVELGRLRQLLKAAVTSGDAVVISAIEGMAGVGKTQLAIHAGHLLAGEEPFEQVLFVNLRGFHPDPAQPPADPAAVLDSFLRLLGVPGQQIPHDQAARAALYQRRLAGRHILIVLDNAANEQQVRPLLPGSPGCLTLITSRRSLHGLPATHLPVDVFTPAEALDFLTRAAPDMAAGEDPDARARIAVCCGYLPLALGLVAGHMRTKPGWTLSDHADWLERRHRQRRLDHGVELALSLSYQHLSAERRRLLRLLALHPGHDWDTYAAAALTDTDTADEHLRHLCRDHLLQQPIPGRFVFHDLVRAYAAERATDEDRPAQRHAALTRLFDYYLATAAAAMDTLHAAEAYRRPRIPSPTTPTPALAQPDTARAWLDTERPCLVAVATHTAEHGWPSHTVRLSAVLFRYLAGGYPADALAVHTHARDAARQTGDRSGEARALYRLGYTHCRLSRYGPAADHQEQALILSRQAGDQISEAMALDNLGIIQHYLGRHAPAADHHRQALALFRQAGDLVGEANALNNLGMLEELLGEYGPAADHLQQALNLDRQIGNRNGEAATLNNLGMLEERLGRYRPAAEHRRQALALYRQIGHPRGEAIALDGLGTVHTRLGQPEQATEHHLQALTLLRETGYRDGEAWVLNGLGEAAHAAGHPTDALTHHTAALTIAIDIGRRDQQARAHTGLGHIHRTLGELAHARQRYAHALAIYTDLGSPDAEDVRTHLDALANHSDERRW
jgi:tetratricopeptide (TPR) repeat protein